ncbi:HalOD1 output domain-containing protein [Haloarcula amylovorans]|uniref:HalOD1 output domain-containing protein n=1 Tax=Haloarcula amylovorans TaxID=2562280 RepID=UPI001076AC2E|nr:HalOD1 output domain-containing protein [Halomicroarcula amylolytica]
MNSDEGTVYMIRGRTADEGGDEWVSPEPADDVITDAVVDATDRTVDEIDAIETYVDADELRAVLGDGDRETITFDVAGHDVTVTANGEVTVA